MQDACRATACRCPEVPDGLARKEPPRLPELAENEIVRHFTNLADRNFGIDTGFYPLGSCTMKYNPRVNERVVALPGFAQSPPPSGGRGRPGSARADVGAAGDPRRGGGAAGGDAAARRRLAGRADGPDADARLLRRPGRRGAARHDHHGRHRPRHESGERHDGRLQAREGRHDRARQPRPRRPAGQGERAHRRADADEPVDARAVRRGHRPRWPRSSIREERCSTTTAPT